MAEKSASSLVRRRQIVPKKALAAIAVASSGAVGEKTSTAGAFNGMPAR